MLQVELSHDCVARVLQVELSHDCVARVLQVELSGMRPMLTTGGYVAVLQECCKLSFRMTVLQLQVELSGMRLMLTTGVDEHVEDGCGRQGPVRATARRSRQRRMAAAIKDPCARQHGGPG